MADPAPRRGQIWYTQLPFDPPERYRRPVVVVSLDARNLNERADTVLVIPLSTSIVKPISTHLLLLAGETGLQHDSVACAENITTVRKTVLVAPDSGLRTISHRRIAELAEKVQLAMGVV